MDTHKLTPENLREFLATVIAHEVETTGDTTLGGLSRQDEGLPAANDAGDGPETDVLF